MPGTEGRMPRQRGTTTKSATSITNKFSLRDYTPRFETPSTFLEDGIDKIERENSFGHQSYQKTRQNAFRQDSQELCLLRESGRRVEGMWSSELTTIEPIPG